MASSVIATWMIDWSLGLGQSLPFRNAGASANKGRFPVLASAGNCTARRRRRSVVVERWRFRGILV